MTIQDLIDYCKNNNISLDTEIGCGKIMQFLVNEINYIPENNLLLISSSYDTLSYHNFIRETYNKYAPLPSTQPPDNVKLHENVQIPKPIPSQKPNSGEMTKGG